MPIYELECKCGHKKEDFAHKKEDVDTNCPVCKGFMKVVMSASNLRVSYSETISQGEVK